MYIEHPYFYEGKYYANIDGEMIEITKEVAYAMNNFYRSSKAKKVEIKNEEGKVVDTGALQGERTAIKAGDTITKEYPSGESASNTITKASNGKVSLITTAPQVRRLYFHPEYHFQTGENPNARGRWYADWLPGGKEADFAAKAFKEIYRRLTGI